VIHRPYNGVKTAMQYTVRNRRRLRTTEQQLAARTSTQRGTGVSDRLPADAIPDAVPQHEPTSPIARGSSATPQRVRAQGTGSHAAQPTRLAVKEIVHASVFRKNSDR
jgi:hypothetical protein